MCHNAYSYVLASFPSFPTVQYRANPNPPFLHTGVDSNEKLDGGSRPSYLHVWIMLASTQEGERRLSSSTQPGCEARVMQSWLFPYSSTPHTKMVFADLACGT